MLSALRIQNLALVEDLALEFQPGFTVLTGETGSGKSLLVDALSLLVGARADGEAVRHGAERAVAEGVVEGDFELWQDFLGARGLPEEVPVVLRREVSASGRSRAWINGAATSLTDLKEAGRLWMRLASQHDHQSLMQEERHLALLDEVLGLKPDLETAVQSVREAESRLKARRKSEAQRADRLVWLAEQLEQLEKLSPREGEWSQLREEREPLRHAAHLEVSYREAAEALGSALPEAEAGARALVRAASILPAAQLESDRLRSTLLELEDLLATFRDQCVHWGRHGAERLEIIEERLAAFERLARRHRCEPDELAGRHKALLEEQRDLEGGSASMEQLERDLERACAVYLAEAGAVHEARASRLGDLEREVHARLARLGMGGARLQVRLAVAGEGGSPVLHQGRPVKLAATGYSQAALWIESNPGEGYRPLAKIASGGELSRVLLSFQGAGAILGRTKPEPMTLVLDEVDAGLGGETALAVGQAMADLAQFHQVLSVTHLAQVAARADHHGRLSKETLSGRTRSALTWVRDDAQVAELARLLSGHPDRPEALAHARTLVG